MSAQAPWAERTAQIKARVTPEEAHVYKVAAAREGTTIQAVIKTALDDLANRNA